MNNNPLPIGGLTVQDYPQTKPVYNGVNPHYPNLQVIHQNPPIFAVPDFLSPTECDFLICIAQDCFTPAPVVGKGAGEVSSSRTSSTCYLAREDLPEYLNKVSLLTGKPIEHCELPQVGRYFPSQQYLQHFDAFDLSNEDGVRFASNGGQRTVTVLTYLNDVERGGHTAFPNLNLEVQPKKGMALVFFPATVDGLLDKNALHAAMPAIDTKYVSQVWIRQGRYEGVPSKRIFTSPEQALMVQKSLICAREGSLSSTTSSQFLSDLNSNSNHGAN
jgi:prolyl 4-hydroxylase